jgi:hypothetical protein
VVSHGHWQLKSWNVRDEILTYAEYTIDRRLLIASI